MIARSCPGPRLQAEPRARPNHHHWTDLLAVIVSLVGWIALVEGIAMMIASRPLLIFFRPLIGSQRAISLFAAVFGIVLIALGLTGHADPTAL